MELSNEETRHAERLVKRAQAVIKAAKGPLLMQDWEFLIEPRPAIHMPNENVVMNIHSEPGNKRAHILINMDYDIDSNVLMGSFEEVMLHEMVHAMLEDSGLRTFGGLLPEADSERFHRTEDEFCDRLGRILKGLILD